MRLINADELKKEFGKYFDGAYTPIKSMMIHASVVLSTIDAAPTIDPVIHSKPISGGWDEAWCTWDTCSNCGHENMTGMNYCNHCGAKLDE